MKLSHYLYMAIFLMPALIFTSCRDMEDTDQSMVLSGQWHGNFGMFYEYVDRYGRSYIFDSYNTYLTFIPARNYATYGRGTQVDYYDYGPYLYQYYQFNWSVRNGIVYLTYPYDPELNTTIGSYRMTNDYFTGYCNGASEPFRLYKLVDYYDWSPYTGSYGYYDRNDWGSYYPYYVPHSRSAEEVSSDSLDTKGSVIKRGRRITY